MRSEFEKLVEPINQLIEAYPWKKPDYYAQYLAQTYYYVRHSTRLLAACAARMPQADEMIHQRFLQHGSEEKGHQHMATKDLKHLGYSIEQFPELPGTAFLWQTQYYKAMYEEPTAFFGYVLALEGLSSTKAPWIYEQVKGCYDEKACVFLKVHGVVDQEHIEQAFHMVSLLSEERQKAIEINLVQSCRAIENFFDEIARAAHVMTLQKSAA